MRVSWKAVCAVACLLAIAAVLVWPIRSDRPESSSNVSVSAEFQLPTAEIDKYLATHTALPRWWLGVGSWQQQIPTIGRQTRKIEQIIKGCRDTEGASPEVQRIAQQVSARFTYLLPGFTSTLDGTAVIVGSKREMDRALKTGGLTVAFLPQSAVNLSRSIVWFDARQDSLRLPAIVWPPEAERVLTGFVCHELGHAVASQMGWSSSTAPPDSDSYIGEEVLMHELEDSVWNSGSHGAYHRLLDRMAKGTDWRQSIARVTAAELVQLDSSIGASRLSQPVASLVVAQHLMSVGLASLRRSGLRNAKLQTERLALYRALTS